MAVAVLVLLLHLMLVLAVALLWPLVSSSFEMIQNLLFVQFLEGGRLLVVVLINEKSKKVE